MLFGSRQFILPSGDVQLNNVPTKRMLYDNTTNDTEQTLRDIFSMLQRVNDSTAFIEKCHSKLSSASEVKKAMKPPGIYHNRH